MLCTLLFCELFTAMRIDPQGHNTNHANDHGESVLINVTGLEQAWTRWQPSNQLCRSINDESIDDRDVAPFQTRFTQQRTTGE